MERGRSRGFATLAESQYPHDSLPNRPRETPPTRGAQGKCMTVEPTFKGEMNMATNEDDPVAATLKIPPMKVWQIADGDWWMAPTHVDAIGAAMKLYGLPADE